MAGHDDADEAPHAHAGFEDPWARRAIRTLQGRSETQERLWIQRFDLMSKAVSENNRLLTTGFRLLGVDVMVKAAAARQNGPIPPPLPREEPEVREPSASHPALDELADAGQTLNKAAERLFEAAEAHTKPDVPLALRTTDSERIRKVQAEAIGKRVLKVWDGALVEIIKALVLAGLGYAIATMHH